MTSFREVLEKMLVIVVLPVRNSLRRENELFSSHLVSNTCGLLASIVSELTASALGSEVSVILRLDNKHMIKLPAEFLFSYIFVFVETDFTPTVVFCFSLSFFDLIVTEFFSHYHLVPLYPLLPVFS